MRRTLTTLAIASLFAGAMTTTATAAGPRPDFQLPFVCGQKWQLNSYDSTHAPALDMVKEPNQVGTEGAPFLAAAAGTVRQSFYHHNAGNMIQIDHGGGWFTTGIHLQSRAVSVGQKVKQGQQIGKVGKTGPTSNGHPHLHFEQAFDANGDGRATWGAVGSERVAQVFDGKTYGAKTGETWNDVPSNNCGDEQETHGVDSAGYYDPRDGTFHLRNSQSDGPSNYGWDTALETIPGAVVLIGDWNGDGKDSTGYYDRRDGTFHLRNALDEGASNAAWDTALETIPNAVVLTGDWNADKKDSTGYYNPTDGTFHIRNDHSDGASNAAWDTGLETIPGAVVLTGDWNGDGKDSTGYYDPRDGTFHLSNDHANGASDYAWGTNLESVPNAVILTGDWNGDGKDSVGYYNPADGSFHLRNALNDGASDRAWDTGYESVPGVVALTGDWDGA